jgi:hypothetical protein
MISRYYVPLAEGNGNFLMEFMTSVGMKCEQIADKASRFNGISGDTCNVSKINIETIKLFVISCPLAIIVGRYYLSCPIIDIPVYPAVDGG